MKHYRIREEMNSIAEPPRKTWFWELGEAVIDADRCVECGICVAVCPSNSIGVSPTTGRPELVKMCTGCSLCWDFCPRAGLRFEATWTPDVETEAGTSDGVAGADEDPAPWTITPSTMGRDLGRVEEAFAVRARDVPSHAQDGGAVTTLLGALLELGEIDGALVSKPSELPTEQWKGVATIATSAAELHAAAGSFYNQTMALAELDLTKYSLPESPRLALVGTPCEVQGLRAMQMRPWDTGAHRVDSVALTIALFCTKSFDYQRLMVQELADKRMVDLSQVAKVDITRGRLTVEDHRGRVVVDEPVKAFFGAALKGCRECADFVGRAADLSVGSVGSMDGWTTVLVRTERGREMFNKARHLFDIQDLVDLDAVERLDTLNKRTALDALQREFDPDGPMFIEYGKHAIGPPVLERTPVSIGH
jgi:coenzyme F420 hydrogenase subunit beta